MDAQPASFYAQRVAEKLPTSDNPENDAVIAHALEALQLNDGDVLVDFGCGDGYFTAKLCTSGHHIRCVGYDVVPHSRWPELNNRHGDLSFGVVSGAMLPLADASVDKIFCSQVIEHVPDAQQLIVEFMRVLKPGGRAWIATPNSYGSMLPIFRPLQQRIDAVEGHVRHFSAHDFSELLINQNARVIKVRYDLFIGLWLYYSVTYFMPSLKRKMASAAIEVAQQAPADGTSTRSVIGRLIRNVAFCGLIVLRRIDSFWEKSPLCQVIEVTIEKM